MKTTIQATALLHLLAFGLSLSFAFDITAQEVLENSSDVVIVVGAGGEPEYESDFQSAAQRWVDTCKAGNVTCKAIGLSRRPDDEMGLQDREILLAEIQRWQEDTLTTKWLVLSGHGTSSTQATNFNLRCKDISVADVKAGLSKIQSKVVIAACFSTRGAWLPE